MGLPIKNISDLSFTTKENEKCLPAEKCGYVLILFQEYLAKWKQSSKDTENLILFVYKIQTNWLDELCAIMVSEGFVMCRMELRDKSQRWGIMRLIAKEVSKSPKEFKTYL